MTFSSNFFGITVGITELKIAGAAALLSLIDADRSCG
jgi:hypothetical protein